ncbi:hypothetical protein [Emticicia fluvialis]|uniref:hypothetical protein n=1 Tax=Emticicia fluvialis TaxID=2974474 RepID=UPI0021664449|nr:hypothetical protein [Emticicia fluvialis]
MILNLLISLLLIHAGEHPSVNNLINVKANATSVATLQRHALKDTTFTLKIENDKRVVDNALKARLTKEIKTAIVANKLKKPYKLAMGFTRGARDVETFLFGEQLFYSLAESGFTINGKPIELPDAKPNPIPQIKVIDNIIYVVLSKM